MEMNDRAAERMSIALSALALIGIVVGFAAWHGGADSLAMAGFSLVYGAGFGARARSILIF